MADRTSGYNKKEEQLLRAAMYVRRSHVLDGFRETLVQLMGILRTFATSKNYDVTFHALQAISDLIARYLTQRSGSIIMPTSVTSMLGDLAPPHDSFLIEQMEAISALHKTAIKSEDVELSREIIQFLQFLGLHSLDVRTLAELPGENDITNLFVGYLQGATEDGAVQALYDVALNGCRALGSIGTAATARRLYLTNHIIVGGLEKIAYMGVVQRKPYVVGAAMRSIAETAAVCVQMSLGGTGILINALETQNRVAIQEASLPADWLAGSLDIQTALGPFLGIGNTTSLERLEALAAQRFELAYNDEEKIQDAAETVEELNRPLPRMLSDLGVASARTKSFALHFINVSISAIANLQLNLYSRISERPSAAANRWDKARFEQHLLHDLEWLVSGVHSRIYDAFARPITLNIVWRFFKTLSQIGIRCVEMDLTEPALGVIQNLAHMAKTSLDVQFEDGFGPPRIAEYIARIGIIAQKRGRESILIAALESLRAFQMAYAQRVRGIAQFEWQLIYEIESLANEWRERSAVIDRDDAYFFSRLEYGDVERFAEIVRQYLQQ
jgi:hypothetical protein